MANVVGERYQITIDKKVRDQLDVKPGDQAVEWVEDGRLVIAFLPRPHNESMLGIIKRMTDQRVEPITDWQAAKEAAWDARVDEIAEALKLDSLRHAKGRRKR